MYGIFYNIWNVDYNFSNIVDGYMVERGRIEDVFYIFYNKGFFEVFCFFDVYLGEYLLM